MGPGEGGPAAGSTPNFPFFARLLFFPRLVSLRDGRGRNHWIRCLWLPLQWAFGTCLEASPSGRQKRH